MKKQYYIMISMNTRMGYECIGQYALGNNPQRADDIFSKLWGSNTITDHTKLHLDLVEMDGELPVKVKTIGCSLEEFGHNAKLIARDFFEQN